MARPGAPVRQASRDKFDGEKVFGDADAFDYGFFDRDHGHFRSRNRRFFVNLFRNKRRRFLKHTEFARHLLERLLLVGLVKVEVVEVFHDGGFDDF